MANCYVARTYSINQRFLYLTIKLIVCRQQTRPSNQITNESGQFEAGIQQQFRIVQKFHRMYFKSGIFFCFRRTIAYRQCAQGRCSISLACQSAKSKLQKHVKFASKEQAQLSDALVFQQIRQFSNWILFEQSVSSWVDNSVTDGQSRMFWFNKGAKNRVRTLPNLLHLLFLIIDQPLQTLTYTVSITNLIQLCVVQTLTYHFELFVWQLCCQESNHQQPWYLCRTEERFDIFSAGR